jgi:hypothetical protein
MSDSLSQIGTQLLRATLPVIIIIGVVGNSLNIAVLIRPALYRYSCSRYFLALASNNLFYSGIIFTYHLLASGYQINPSNYSVISCKIITYILTLSSFLSPYLIVCASIDRYCASSINANLRKFSNIKVARWAILFVIIVIMLFYINTIILIELRSTNAFGCYIQADTTYKKIYPIMEAVVFAIIPPSLMVLFGMLTIYNIKQVHVIPAAMSRHRRTENQLAGMLLLQAGAYIVLTVPSVVTYLMIIFPNTIDATSVFYFVTITTELLYYCSFATSFVLYFISASTYRKELIELIYRIFRLRGRNGIHPVTNTITNTMVPMTTMANRLPSKR